MENQKVYKLNSSIENERINGIDYVSMYPISIKQQPIPLMPLPIRSN